MVDVYFCRYEGFEYDVNRMIKDLIVFFCVLWGCMWWFLGVLGNWSLLCLVFCCGCGG